MQRNREKTGRTEKNEEKNVINKKARMEREKKTEKSSGKKKGWKEKGL